MSIEFWIFLWKVVLIGGVGMFAALAFVVAIGGAFDVGHLLKTLREEHARSIADTADGDDASASRQPQASD